jgi:hypothetical protein
MWHTVKGGLSPREADSGCGWEPAGTGPAEVSTVVVIRGSEKSVLVDIGVRVLSASSRTSA